MRIYALISLLIFTGLSQNTRAAAPPDPHACVLKRFAELVENPKVNFSQLTKPQRAFFDEVMIRYFGKAAFELVEENSRIIRPCEAKDNCVILAFPDVDFEYYDGPFGNLEIQWIPGISKPFAHRDEGASGSVVDVLAIPENSVPGSFDSTRWEAVLEDWTEDHPIGFLLHDRQSDIAHKESLEIFKDETPEPEVPVSTTPEDYDPFHVDENPNLLVDDDAIEAITLEAPSSTMPTTGEFDPLFVDKSENRLVPVESTATSKTKPERKPRAPAAKPAVVEAPSKPRLAVKQEEFTTFLKQLQTVQNTSGVTLYKSDPEMTRFILASFFLKGEDVRTIANIIQQPEVDVQLFINAHLAKNRDYIDIRALGAKTKAAAMHAREAAGSLPADQYRQREAAILEAYFLKGKTHGEIVNELKAPTRVVTETVAKFRESHPKLFNDHLMQLVRIETAGQAEPALLAEAKTIVEKVRSALSEGLPNFTLGEVGMLSDFYLEGLSAPEIAAKLSTPDRSVRAVLEKFNRLYPITKTREAIGVIRGVAKRSSVSDDEWQKFFSQRTKVREVLTELRHAPSPKQNNVNILLSYYEEGLSIPEIAERYQVGEASIKKIIDDSRPAYPQFTQAMHDHAAATHEFYQIPHTEVTHFRMAENFLKAVIANPTQSLNAPAGKARVIEEHFIKGKAYAEIADELGSSVSNISKIIGEAKADPQFKELTDDLSAMARKMRIKTEHEVKDAELVRGTELLLLNSAKNELRGLNEREIKILHSYYIQGLSVKEVCQQLRVGDALVRSTISKATPFKHGGKPIFDENLLAATHRWQISKSITETDTARFNFSKKQLEPLLAPMHAQGTQASKYLEMMFKYYILGADRQALQTEYGISAETFRSEAYAYRQRFPFLTEEIRGVALLRTRMGPLFDQLSGIELPSLNQEQFKYIEDYYVAELSIEKIAEKYQVEKTRVTRTLFDFKNAIALENP